MVVKHETQYTTNTVFPSDDESQSLNFTLEAHHINMHKDIWLIPGRHFFFLCGDVDHNCHII